MKRGTVYFILSSQTFPISALQQPHSKFKAPLHGMEIFKLTSEQASPTYRFVCNKKECLTIHDQYKYKGFKSGSHMDGWHMPEEASLPGTNWYKGAVFLVDFRLL